MQKLQLTDQSTDTGVDESLEVLRQNSALFRVIFEGSSVGMALLDLNGRFERSNPALHLMLGHNREALSNLLFSDLTHPDDRPMELELFAQLAQGTRDQFQIDNRFIRKGGSVIWARCSATLVRSSQGKPCGVICQIEDISEQARSQRTIRELAAFAEFNPNPVFEFSPDGGLRYSNRAALELARLMGKNDPGGILPAQTRELVAECWITGRSKLRMTTQLGNRTISWSFFPIPAVGRVHCYAGDVTERQALEDQLRQSQKLEAVGHLAAGVAHDFNNILTIVHGNASILLSDKNLATSSQECAKQVAQAAERGASLTRQLLVFSRKQVLLPSNLSLNEVVENMNRMLKRLLGENVELGADLDPELPLIYADVGMIEQVVMNLAVNARDAMARGGILTIGTKTERIEYTSEKDAALGARPGRFVCLSVQDTGCGILPEHMDRIFEPFFTTKEAGKGTGLGLATVYGIVRQHHGWIKVDSTPGTGTVFRIFFPAVDGVAESSEPPPPVPVEDKGTETILVVEDEGPLLDMVLSLLQRCGYTVLGAATVEEAIALWDAHKDIIHLLFTDLVMPGGEGGKDLARRFGADKPELKVIFSSGYALDPGTRGELAVGKRVFLQKPYHPQKLARVVRECLDGKNVPCT